MTIRSHGHRVRPFGDRTSERRGVERRGGERRGGERRGGGPAAVLAAGPAAVLAAVLLLASAAALVAAPAASASPPPLPLFWSDTYLGIDHDSAELVGAATAPDGSTYAAGKANHLTHGYDVILMRHRPDGSRAWVRTFDSVAHNDEQALAVATSKAGIIVTTGRCRPTGGAWDVLTTAWSTSGTRLWVRRLLVDDSLSSEGRDVLVTPVGEIYITGTLVRDGNQDLFVAKYSKNGTLLWKKYVAGSARGWDQGNALARDGAGNIYAAGFVTQSTTGRDYVLVKYRPDGTRLWVKRTDAGALHDEWANDIAIRDTFVVLAGGGVDVDGDECGSLARFDTAGSLWWIKVVDTAGSLSSEYAAVGVDRYCHTIVAGWKDFDLGENEDAFVARYEPAGDFDWQWYHQGAFGSDDRLTGLAVTTEGDAYIGGYWGGFGSGLDLFVAKLRPSGWETALVWWNDIGNGDDGALALSLGSGGVLLAGASEDRALMLRYGREPEVP